MQQSAVWPGLKQSRWQHTGPPSQAALTLTQPRCEGLSRSLQGQRAPGITGESGAGLDVLRDQLGGAVSSDEVGGEAKGSHSSPAGCQLPRGLLSEWPTSMPS